MRLNEQPEPIVFGTEDLRRILEEYTATATALLEALHATAACELSPDWRPHLPQMHAALASFAELCRDELEQLGDWRDDGRDAGEVHEFIWNEAERVMRWLKRMIE
jgi:hypothetical protein